VSGDSTRAAHAGAPEAEQFAPFLPGPVLAAPYHLAGPGDPRGYGRYANPTWEAYERALGDLEGGEAVVFSSGMAAAS
jgi:cystathionine gamma-lyase